MDITIYPAKLHGAVDAIPSKSQMHRYLICAAFADAQTELRCAQSSRDVDATAACLRALGAHIVRTQTGFLVEPAREIPARAVLPCGESGSTLRFLLPIVGALGVDAMFLLEGRLSHRPLQPLQALMEAKGCVITRPTSDTMRCTGQLKSGEYSLDGSVSSQFVTGLLLASALMQGKSRIVLTGKVESKPYITMTQEAMTAFGVETRDFTVCADGFHSPKKLCVEGDWSNAAFFLAANRLGSDIEVKNLRMDSVQGDRAAASLLPALEKWITVSAADIPDLIPILAVTAAAKRGAVFANIGRLRMKESDRVASTAALLRALGVTVETTDDEMRVYPALLHGGTVDCANDHRIAMAAAIAATAAAAPVKLLGAQCVEKSYPAFWQDYRALGGNYEQHIR